MQFKTKEHYDIILRQVSKLYDHRNKTTPREVRRKEAEYKLLKSILNKMQPPPASPNQEPNLEVRFTRQELRAVQSLCVSGKKLLNELLIPGYEERMRKEDDEKIKANYKTYLDKAEATNIMYSEILAEVDNAL